MRSILRAIALTFVVALATEAMAQDMQPGPTHQAVREGGVLLCGGSPNAPGFGAPDSRGNRRGIDPGICRAVASPAMPATMGR